MSCSEIYLGCLGRWRSGFTWPAHTCGLAFPAFPSSWASLIQVGSRKGGKGGCPLTHQPGREAVFGKREEGVKERGRGPLSCPPAKSVCQEPWKAGAVLALGFVAGRRVGCDLPDVLVGCPAPHMLEEEK